MITHNWQYSHKCSYISLTITMFFTTHNSNNFLWLSLFFMNAALYLTMTFTFTFMHLADAFIQSNLQCIQAIILFPVCVFPELNPQPFVLLTQCSTTEPQGHYITTLQYNFISHNVTLYHTTATLFIMIFLINVALYITTKCVTILQVQY